ncbi:CHAT domain-containing protein, partial [Spirillospora sp. NPDC050679]
MDDRDRALRALRDRLDEDDPAAVCAEEADAELRMLLRGSPDLRTDREARQTAARVLSARAAACEPGAGDYAVLFLTGMSNVLLDPEPLGPEEWGELAAYAVTEHRRTGEERALMAALVWCELVLAATPESHPDFVARLANHGVVLYEAASFMRDKEPLERAMRFLGTALEHTPPDAPEALTRLSGYSAMWLLRYDLSGAIEDLAEAERIACAVLERAGDAHPERARFLSELAQARSKRLHWNGITRQVYDETVEMWRQVVRLGRPDDRVNLAGALQERYGFAGEPADLDEAIALLQDLLVAWRTRPVAIVAVQNNLGFALHQRHELAGCAEDGEEAVRLLREAVAAQPLDDYTASRWINLALALRTRFLRAADPADIVEAVDRARQAVRTVPEGHPQHAAFGNMLGLMLLTRYEHTRERDDLDQAVAVLRAAVQETRPGDAALDRRLLNLSNALLRRYDLTGDGADLAEVRALRARLMGLGEEAGQSDERRAARISSYALGELRRMEREGTGRVAEAVEMLRTALDLTAPGSLTRPVRQLNLAVALLTEAGFRRGEAAARAREEAAALVRSALAALPPDSVERGRFLSTLARIETLAAGARWRGRRSDLDRIIDLLRQAREATSAGSQRQAARLWNLAELLEVRHRRFRDAADLAEAADLYRSAAGVRGAAPAERAEAARGWGRCLAATGDWAGAADGFAHAIELLPAIAPRHLLRDDQELGLSPFTGLAAEAAACALNAGDPLRAVLLLEQGRGVLQTHAYDARGDLTTLERLAPDLAERFTRLRDEIDTVGDDLAPEPGGADHRGRLAGEWERLLARIRAHHPDLAGFLRPPTDSDLRAAASGGPVVVVNVHDHRSDAVLVTAQGIEVLPLPGLRPKDAAHLTAVLDTALEVLERPGTGPRKSRLMQGQIRYVLKHLWEDLVGPVLDRLGYREPVPDGAPPPRIWWSPGAPLARLPLHAAAKGGADALDRVVSSYVSTVRELRYARERAAAAADPGDPLVVAVPDVPGLPRLPATRKEADAIAGLFPGATVLTGPEAAHDALAAALPSHPCVHLACHAVADLDRPSHSRLVLADDRDRPRGRGGGPPGGAARGRPGDPGAGGPPPPGQAPARPGGG